MKIELKNIKYAAFASEETNCFEASVYVDGKKAGTVSNEGRGGADKIEPYELQKRITEYAATLPHIDISNIYKDGQKHTMPQCSETLIGDLMEEWIERRDLKRLCSKKVLFRIPGQVYEKGEYHTLNCKFSAEVKVKLVAKHGADVAILNETLV